MGFFSIITHLTAVKSAAVMTTAPVPTPSALPTTIYTPMLAVHTLGCNLQYAATHPGSIQYSNTTSTTTVLSGTLAVLPTVTGAVYSTLTNYATITTTRASGVTTQYVTVTSTPLVQSTRKIYGSCGPKPAVMKREAVATAGAGIVEKRQVASSTVTEYRMDFVAAATCSMEATLYLPAATTTSTITVTPTTTVTATITKEAITPAQTVAVTQTSTAPVHTVVHCAQCRGLAKQGCALYDVIW
ncbi:hypothetical protein B9Z65_5757 [Elsinoe australis]|uniref:Uncharacterized protein n=1 Tax=Elsinoe australis TaxID=40998 RepID=A0A2P7YIZ4_9PEZI|nr:hypothetical protein B9Z65_5757 [Elsinoe australis]